MVRRGKVVEMGVQASVLDFGVVAAIQRSDALPDRHAQLVELESFLGPPLLQRTDGVAHRFAGVAVFARVEHLVDESILLRRQADIAGRHRSNLADFIEGR